MNARAACLYLQTVNLGLERWCGQTGKCPNCGRQQWRLKTSKCLSCGKECCERCGLLMLIIENEGEMRACSEECSQRFEREALILARTPFPIGTEPICTFSMLWRKLGGILSVCSHLSSLTKHSCRDLVI